MIIKTKSKREPLLSESSNDAPSPSALLNPHEGGSPTESSPDGEALYNEQVKLYSASEATLTKKDQLFLDQLRDLSSNQRHKLVQLEKDTNWISVMALNQGIMAASTQIVMACTWMIVVTANHNLTFITFCFTSFFFLKFLTEFLASLVNDKSQFAKFFLVFSQTLGLLSGFFMIYSAKSYSIETESGTRDTDDIELHSIQTEGVSLNSSIALLISIQLMAMWQGIQTQVQKQYTMNSFTKDQNELATHMLQMAKYGGDIFGCVAAYWLLSSGWLIESQFDGQFLSVKSQVDHHQAVDEGLPQENVRYHYIISQFQAALGYMMTLFGVIAIANTFLRFFEISEFDRE